MNRLKELRLKHGFKSQNDLASFLYVNQTAVSQWERGVTIPSSQMLLKLSEVYGVSVDYLLGRDEDETKKEPTPVSGSEPLYPPKYDLLSPAQKEIVDRLIEDLAKNQSAD